VSRVCKRAEFLLERRRLDEEQVRAGREIVGEPGLRRIEPDAGRRREGDGLHRGARALRDGIKFADRLDLVAEEIQAVGLVGRDGVDVDDAAADRVVAWGFADGLGVVIEFLELLEQALERLRLAAAERQLAGREFLQRRHLLQERGGRGDDDEGVGRRRQTPGGPETREHGQTIA